MKYFKAMVVRETPDKKYAREIVQRPIADLPSGDVLVRVGYSSLNYKDALSATGHKGVTKKYPHTPGIDAAGVVEESSGAEFKPADEVIVTGHDLGQDTSGGWAEYIRVPADWVVKKPAGITLKESMAFGTAGFTAAYSLLKLQSHGVTREQGDVLVTGASGGVGSLAVAILAKNRYRVTAATGKADAREFLARIGATNVIGREEVDDKSGRTLLPQRWAGVIDTVGGNILATAIKSTQYHGTVTCCGLVASGELPTTVYPFILRGVNLLGVDSAQCPKPTRLLLWEKLSGEWKPDNLAMIYSECALEELDEKIDRILKGQIRGRTLVAINP